MPNYSLKRIHFLLVGLLFAIYLLNGILAIPSLSVVGDEGDHYNYAVRVVKGKPDKVKPLEDASCMPLSALNTIPRAFQQLLNPQLSRQDNGKEDITHGRYITLLLGLLLAFYVYRWSKEWYGENGALISLSFFVFCPNLNAYSVFVMTDLFAALFTIIPLYHYWKYREAGSLRQFIYFSATLALAQIAKPSMPHLYLVFFVIGLVHYFTQTKKKRIGPLFMKFLLFLAIQLFVINAAFLFRHSGQSLNSYRFTSRAFLNIQKNTGVLGTIPLPLPEPWLQGMDQVMHVVELGPGNKDAAADNYLFGEKRRGIFPYYFLAIIFYKTPLFTLVAVLAALYLMIARFNFSFWRNEFLLLLPVVYFITYFSLFVSIQGGIRYILMVFPLLYILCGRLVMLDLRGSKWLWAGGLIYLICSFYFYWPNLVPYTNELIPDKKMAYRIMADSNLDLGQANYFLDKFLKDHPEYKAAPLEPAAGKFYIGVNDLLDLYDEGRYVWLLKNFKPSDHLAHSILLFNITQAELQAKTGIGN